MEMSMNETGNSRRGHGKFILKASVYNILTFAAALLLHVADESRRSARLHYGVWMLRMKSAGLMRLRDVCRVRGRMSSARSDNIWSSVMSSRGFEGANSAIGDVFAWRLCGHTFWHVSHPAMRPPSFTPSGKSPPVFYGEAAETS